MQNRKQGNELRKDQNLFKFKENLIGDRLQRQNNMYIIETQNTNMKSDESV